MLRRNIEQPPNKKSFMRVPETLWRRVPETLVSVAGRKAGRIVVESVNYPINYRSYRHPRSISFDIHSSRTFGCCLHLVLAASITPLEQRRRIPFIIYTNEASAIQRLFGRKKSAWIEFLPTVVFVFLRCHVKRDGIKGLQVYAQRIQLDALA